MFNALVVNDGIMAKLGEARMLSAQFKTDPCPRKVDLGAGGEKFDGGYTAAGEVTACGV